MKFLLDSSKILKLLEPVPRDSSIALYGAGRSGKDLFRIIEKHRKDLKVTFFIDSFASGHLENRKVFCKDELDFDNLECDLVLVISSSWQEISSFLDTQNFSKYLLIKKEPSFSGWGLTTEATVPWKDGFGNDTFLRTHKDLKSGFKFSGPHYISDNLDNTMYRHWVLAFAVKYAIQFSNSSDMVLAECGVCDGMTAFFALRELESASMQGTPRSFTLHLYDSWGPMIEDYLSESELGLAGEYGSLDIAQVKLNLEAYRDHVIFHPGYIPETLQDGREQPSKVDFLHIDLNSAGPTLAALDHFFPKMSRGGVIVFDDYGLDNYLETKETVDSFFSDKKGLLMAYPTGQALYFV